MKLLEQVNDWLVRQSTLLRAGWPWNAIAVALVTLAVLGACR